MKRSYVFTLMLLAPLVSCLNSGPSQQEEAKLPQVSASYGCAPKMGDSEWYEKDNKAPLIEGLDVLDYPITTSKPEAQEYFNQGLVLAYGFNHAEAARSFYYAAKLDPDCAMCHWGYALVLGPNYNAGMEPGNYERAWEAVQKAIEVSDNATEKEKAL